MAALAGSSSDKIISLIAREYSFVQELVWLPPRRNPFPCCTDKIVSDFRKLEVLYRRPANIPVRAVPGAHNPTSSRRAADRALSILNADADELIRFRRSLCQKLLSVQASSALNEFEHQAEALIMQHLDSSWRSCKQSSVETWASKVKGLDFQALDMALQHLWASFFGYSIDHASRSLNNSRKREDRGDCGHNSVPLEEKQVENVRDATSLNDGEEDDDDVLSEVDSIEDSPAGQNQDLSLVLISNNEVKHERKQKFPTINSSRGNLPIQIEMTMKARICAKHITASEQHCWHIIFGIVNHEHCEVAVHSLTYWSLDNESEISTIKWPKGGVILKEAPSLLCYSCQMQCAGPSDSPRVAFSWHYRTIPKYPVALRGGINEGMKERAIEAPSLELQTHRAVQMKETTKDSLYIAESSHIAEADVAGPSQTVCQGSGDPFYKRLGSFFPWKDSCKKAKLSTD